MERGAVRAAVAGILALGAVALGACGGADPGGPLVQPQVTDRASAPAAPPQTPAAAGLVDSGYDGRFRATATVLDDSQGPVLCAGAVAYSLPPGCGGPPIVGWDWDAVEHESASGVRWGSYTLVGTWDGETFTLTEPAAAPQPIDGGSPSLEFSVPCETPPGGFEVADPSRATPEDFLAATEALADLPGLGYVAVDQSGDHAGVSAEPTSLDDVLPPEQWVLVVTTTGDLPEAEAAARELWGGPLCVAPAARTQDELRAVQEAITGGEAGEGLVEDSLSVGVDVQNEQVTVGVLVATADLQQRLDAEFGEGVVRLEGALQPID